MIVHGALVQLTFKSATHFGSPARPLFVVVTPWNRVNLSFSVVGHLAEQRERTPAAHVLTEPGGEIEALVQLLVDVEVRILDRQDVELVRCVRRCTGEQRAQRIIGEAVRRVTAKQDVRRPQLRDLVLHVDIDVIDRKAELASRHSQPSGVKIALRVRAFDVSGSR